MEFNFNAEEFRHRLRERPMQIKVGLAAVFLVFALVLLVRAWPASEPGKHVPVPKISATGTLYACGDPNCGVTFHLTDEEIAAHEREHPGELYPCPICHAKMSARAAVCPKCGEFTPLLPDHQCVHCKTTLPADIKPVESK